jgi:hypothetical protein
VRPAGRRGRGRLVETRARPHPTRTKQISTRGEPSVPSRRRAGTPCVRVRACARLTRPLPSARWRVGKNSRERERSRSDPLRAIAATAGAGVALPDRAVVARRERAPRREETGGDHDYRQPRREGKGTVNPSDIPMTISRTVALPLKCRSTCGVCGIALLAVCPQDRDRDRGPAACSGPITVWEQTTPSLIPIRSSTTGRRHVRAVAVCPAPSACRHSRSDPADSLLRETRSSGTGFPPGFGTERPPASRPLTPGRTRSPVRSGLDRVLIVYYSTHTV